MRFRYSTIDPAQDEFDSLPRIELTLRRNGRSVRVAGLVDSGATVNVLPYDIGVQLGGQWDDGQAIIRLAGSLGNQSAMPFFTIAQVDGLPEVRLAFAWVRRSDVPLVLGQTNFFSEFEICFYRAQLEFEITPVTSAATALEDR
jgi:hypothetical protein